MEKSTEDQKWRSERNWWGCTNAWAKSNVWRKKMPITCMTSLNLWSSTPMHFLQQSLFWDRNSIWGIIANKTARWNKFKSGSTQCNFFLPFSSLPLRPHRPSLRDSVFCLTLDFYVWFVLFLWPLLVMPRSYSYVCTQELLLPVFKACWGWSQVSHM